MKKTSIVLLFSAALASVSWMTLGCESSATTSHATYEMKKGGKMPPFGGPGDVQRAETLWRTTLRNYRSWPAPAGFAGWQKGKRPHGKALRYFVNPIAARDFTANGALIVKENYMAENGKLVAVTIMQKIPNYDPENQNWFWVKYGPNGEIMKNPKGMKLAGRVAKGMSKGCISCHSLADDDDYLFIND